MELSDTQSERDPRGWPINQVGIKNLLYPVVINGSQTPARFTLTASLAGDLRGTHMSRFVAMLQEYRQDLTPARLGEMLRKLKKSLASESAQAIARFPFFVEKKAPVSQAAGFVAYEAQWDVILSGPRPEVTTTVVVPIGTLCPCSKAISDRGAHNQRGQVTLSYRGNTPPKVTMLAALVENAASCELYSVLKRPDEKFVTERAYDNPTFVEDVARNVAQRCESLTGTRWFRVEVENYESIHFHDAYAVIEAHLPRRTRK
jgi:GTP cyclohydrolase IB